jgi:hypothetical protein
MTTPCLSTSHPKVLAFYEKHNLDFENMSLLFVDILENVMTHLDTSVNAHMATQLLDRMTRMQQGIEALSSVLESKMSIFRKDYMHDLKLILASHHVDQMMPLVRETTSSLLDKTSMVLHECLPKTNETVRKDVQSQLQTLHISLQQEIKTLVEGKGQSLEKRDIEEFLTQVQHVLTQSNQSLLSVVSASETRVANRLNETTQNINEVKQMLREQDNTQLQQNVARVLTKFEVGKVKGTISESVLYNMLIPHYKTADIEYVAKQKHCGDILFQQKDRPKILIENKDHDSCNVPKQDVEKFISDCQAQNCSGILMAQHRGITNKENFEIQIHHGNVLLYLHEVEFRIETIRLAIDVVEHLKIKLDDVYRTSSSSKSASSKEKEVNLHDKIIIEKSVLEEIQREYITFINQKAIVMKLHKENYDKMNEAIVEMKLNDLQSMLAKYFAFSFQRNNLSCQYCNEPVKKSLLQHYRYCLKKKHAENIGNSISLDIESDESKSEN